MAQTDVKSCEYCEHAAFSQGGVYCTYFNEDIWSERRVAEECGEYLPVPWAPVGAKGSVS